MTKPAVVAVSGVKNSGKTWLIAAMLPYLNAAGVRTAVIKHDGHSFDADTPGTDTARHLSAGACGTAVFDGEKFQLVRPAAVSEVDLIPFFPDADLILLEGFKHSAWPKLELVRRGNSGRSVCEARTLLALVTDLDILPDDVPRIPFGDAEVAARVILDYMQRREQS